MARLASTTADHVQAYVNLIASVRNVPAESLKDYAGMMFGFVDRTPAEKLNDWSARQVYIALGNLMTAAAALHVDNCPMEGIVPDEYDKVLGLDKRGLKSVVACALGYRATDDKYASLAKVRFPAEELIVKI